ncbi:MAG: permease-like cell division protein FtsX [Bacillota bacterium]
MKPSTIKYFIREGFGNVQKNLLMTVASVVAVAACISMLAFSYSVAVNLNSVLKQMEDAIGISVFMEGEPTSTDIEILKKAIENIDNVTSVAYISPSDALDALKADWGADEDIFEGLDKNNNPLSHSLQVSINDIRNQGGVLGALEKLSGIENIRHGQTETEFIMKVSQIFNFASIIVMVVLCGISVMIIMNTIRISVANRRVEINIMKYVGATDWFIRWPFILEGVVIGFIGSTIPILLGIPMYSQIVSVIYQAIPISDMVKFQTAGEIYIYFAPIAIAFGVALGTVGSVSSIRKHLQV